MSPTEQTPKQFEKHFFLLLTDQIISQLKILMCVCVCPLLQPVEATDDAFWDQFWADISTSVQDVFALVPAAEIRAVREESPSNLATLCYKVSSRIQTGSCVYYPSVVSGYSRVKFNCKH